MRTDCKHYTRRTSAAGEVRESCRVDAAPDAPYACPEHCPLWEKRVVVRAGWVLGSLGQPEKSPEPEPLPADADGLFAELESEFDAGRVARIEAEEKNRGKGKWRRRKK